MLTHIRDLFLRLIAAGVAFIAAWIVYMIAMVLTVYDGALSLIFQPILGAICSAIAVGLSLLLGLILWIPPFRRLWHGSRIPAILLVSASLFVLCFGYSLGWTDNMTDPETGASFTVLHPAALLSGYFALTFALANFPILRRRASPQLPVAQPLPAPAQATP